MENKFVILTEKEEMWAKMLMEVLEDNGVKCISKPVFGAGFAMRTGTVERLTIYVSEDKLTEAQTLMDQLFSESSIIED